MNKDYIRAFYLSGGSWSGAFTYKPNVAFGIYYKEKGWICKAYMHWFDLWSGDMIPNLNVCPDFWLWFDEFSDVLLELKKVSSKNITDVEFVEILKKCNFKDLTKYDNPYKDSSV